MKCPACGAEICKHQVVDEYWELGDNLEVVGIAVAYVRKEWLECSSGPVKCKWKGTVPE